MQVNDESPAQKAGIAAGDIILQVNGEAVQNLEDFYRKLWHGQPGTEFRLTVLHGVSVRDILVQSMDRKEYLRRKPTI
jgi:S1-C subfamily serine protease